jgi:hypothetical protein
VTEHEDIDLQKAVTEGSLEALDAVWGREGPKTVSEDSVGSTKRIRWIMCVSETCLVCLTRQAAHRNWAGI